MKDMINTQIALNGKLQKKHYSNGQLAIFVYNFNDEPLAELSIVCNSIELAPDEFILKDYSENETLAQKLLIEEKYVTYNELMYARAWCIVAESLLAAAPEEGIQLDESSWKDIAEERLTEAREAASEGGAMEKLESAERSFDNGHYGAAIYDSVYVIENSRAGEIDDENLTLLVAEERVSLWGQVYQSHAAFLLEQNQSVAAYKTAAYAVGLDEATVEMAKAMIPILEEEEQVSEEEDIVPLILVAVGSISFLLIVLLLFMKRGKHGNKN